MDEDDNQPVDDSVGISEHTGFPNAGTDSSLSSLDIAKLLIKNPSSTFFMRVRGDHWEDRGIFDGDVVVVDRVVAASKSGLVIWWENDSFMIGNLRQVPEEVVVWGTVTSVIHLFSRTTGKTSGGSATGKRGPSDDR